VDQAPRVFVRWRIRNSIAADPRDRSVAAVTNRIARLRADQIRVSSKEN
jgi:hypothetical protein